MVLPQIRYRPSAAQPPYRFRNEIALAAFFVFLFALTFSARADDLAARAGQLVVVGFEGDTADAPGFKQVIADLEAGRAGGVIFLSHNVRSRKDVTAMTAAVRACRCKYRPFIALDEEGGKIERLTKRKGFTRSPSAALVGSRGDEDFAREVFDAIARDVADGGFNFNFAPVADLAVNPGNPVIARLRRAYSDSPDAVFRMTRLFIECHRRLGILTAIKHFPGHGSSFVDTHHGWADVTESWSPVELVPFERLIDNDLADAVMVGHVSSNEWKGVATLAPSDAISAMLRDKLGFDGAVITDDLDMGAVTSNSPDFSKTIVRALAAGNDLLLVTNHHSRRADVALTISAAIVAAVADGRLRQERIDGAFARVLALKRRLK
jgi:beta-N-acetylhexosaminidase